MERFRSIVSAHKRIIAALVIMCCIALSACLMLPVFASGDVGDGSQTEITTPVSPQKAIAKPLHDYIELEVETPDGLFVYAGITTLGQLKNNLTVTGTYLPDPEYPTRTASVVLLPSEYILTDGDKVIDKYDDETLVENSAGGGTDLTDSDVIYTVESGSASASTGAITLSQGEIPSYESFKVALKNGVDGIENIFTPDMVKNTDAVKNLIEVFGVSGSAEPVLIVNKELYKISSVSNAADWITVGKEVELYIQYGDMNNWVKMEGTLPIVAAAAPEVSVNVSPELVYQDGFYRYEKDGIYYSAFTKGKTGDNLKQWLQLSLVYKSATITVDGNNLSAYGISRIEVSDAGSGDATYQDIEVKVYFSSNINESVSKTISLPFENVGPVKIIVNSFNGNAITLQPDESGKTVYTYSESIDSSASLDMSLFGFTFVLNNETSDTYSGESAKLAPLTIENTLLPPIGEFDASKPYSKNVVFRSNDNTDVNCTVRFSNITYKGPQAVSFGNIFSNSQKVLSPLDLTGAFVNVYFTDNEDEEGIKVLLSEYPQYCEYKFVYDVRGSEMTLQDWTSDPTVPSNAIEYNNRNLSVYIRFTYQENGEALPAVTSTKFGITVSKAEFDWLALDTKPIVYSKDGCEKTFTDLIERLNATQDDSMQISVSISDGSGTVSGTFSKGGYTSIAQNSDVATLDANGKMSFAHGGTYTVSVSLDSEAFQWINKRSSTNNPKLESETLLQYQIIIQKAPIHVELKYSDDIVYGELENAIAAIKNSGVKMNILGTQTTVSGLGYTFFLSGGSLTQPLSFDKDAIPAVIGYGLGVGNYSLYVKTEDCPDYETTESEPITLTIVAKEIEATGLVKSYTYDRTDYKDKLDEIVKIDDGNFVYGDENETPVSVSSDETEIKHVNKYKIKLTLNNNNYKWKASADYSVDGNVVTTDFEISKRTESISVSVTVSQNETPQGNSYTYGDDNITIESGYSVTSGNAPLFANEKSVTYHKVENGVLGAALDTSDSNFFKTLDAGTYAVKYSFEYGENGETEKDYDLPDNYATFTVNKKYVDTVSIKNADGDDKIYSGSAKPHEFSLENFKSDIMEYEVNSDVTDGIIRNETSVSVVHAGTYTVTVKFKAGAEKNYDWNGTQGELTYTLNKKTVTPAWGVTNFAFDPDYDPTTTDETKQKYPHPTVSGKIDGDDLNFVTVIYRTRGADGAFTDEIAKTVLKESGQYYMVASLSGVAVADYELSGEWTSFIIGRMSIKLPEQTDGYKFAGNEYRGDYFKILDCFLNADRKQYSDGELIITYVVTDGTTTDNQLRNVGTYTFTVTPNSNYVWEGSEDKEVQEVFTYSFEITQKEVELSWDGSAITAYSGSAQAPTVTATPVGTDSAPVVTIGIGADSSDAATGGKTVTNAGEYVAVAVDVDNPNYKISTSNAKYSYSFVIQKQQVVRPEIVSGGEMTFLDTPNITYNTVDGKDIWAYLDGIGYSVTSVSGGLSDAKSPATFAGGTFTYVDKGNYTVTFSLNDYDNYCWKSSEPITDNDALFAGEKDTAISIIVKARLLTINGFTAENRIIPRKEGETYNTIGNLTDGSGFAVSYTTHPEITVEHKVLQDGDESFNKRGIYAVKYTLTDGNSVGGDYDRTKNPENYAWSAGNLNDITDANIKPLLTYEGKIYSIAGNELYVHYAITGQILNLTYNDGNEMTYIFGANVNGDGSAKTNFLFNTLNIGGTDSGILDSENYTLTVKIYKDGATPLATVTYNSETKNYTSTDAENLLESYLPWDAGEYTLAVEWEFGATSQYQASPRSDLKLKVSPLAVTVDLGKLPDGVTEKAGEDNGYTATYKGSAYEFTATVNNAPKRNGSVATVPTVKLTGGGKNAGNYEYKAHIYGDFPNFTADDTVWVKLEITPKKVVIKAKGSQSHTYGDSVSDNTIEWETVGDDGFATETDKADAVERLIAKFGKDGETAELSQFMDAGEYVVTFVQNDDTAFWNNYDFDGSTNTAIYTVNKRSITVSVKGGKIERIYGDSYVLGRVTAENYHDYYEITGGTLPNTTDYLFTAAAKKDGAEIDNRAGFGRYGIELTDTSGNYNITFAGAYEYVINRATLNVNVEISVYYGENSPNDYDGAGSTFAADTSYLYTPTESRNGLIYKIADGDFKFEDKDLFYGEIAPTFGGTFGGYTVNGYTPWVTQPDANITVTFNATDLTWGNYVLVDGRQGKLTVEKQVFTVTLNGARQEYYDEKAALTYELSGEQTSSYGGSGKITHFGGAFDTAEKVFAITVNDLTVDTTTQIVTNGVGRLSISADYATAAVQDCYSITFANSATYEIYAAQLTLNMSIGDVNRAYNEQLYTAKQQSELEVSGKNNPDISGVKYFVSDNSSAPDWETVRFETTAPSVLHAGNYYIHYLISADNHEDLHVSTHVVITTANNGLIDGTEFDYNGKVGDTTDGLSAVWTYGGFGSNMEFSTPKAEFDGTGNGSDWQDGANGFNVTLKFWRTKESMSGTAVKTFGGVLGNGESDNIKTLLCKWFDTDKFNYEAGYYQITFEMSGNGEDYEDLTYSRYFYVDKAVLNIRPKDGETTYGDDFGFGESYGIETPDWQYADRKSDVDVLDLTQFTWYTDYTQGDNAGDKAYDIRIADGNAYTGIDNYTFAFSTDARLTVKKRELTVTVGNHTNSFNFLNDSEDNKPTDVNDITDASGNKLLIVGNSYNGEEPLKLVTDALDGVDRGDGTLATTNNAGEYDITLVWNGDETQVAIYEKNYSVDLTIKGKYTITSAHLNAQADVPENTTYDGKEKAVVVKGKVGDNTETIDYLKFIVSYREENSTTATTDAPINVGKYYVSAVYNASDAQKNNYTVGTSGLTFSISKAKLYVKIANTQIQYGTPFTGSVAWSGGNTAELGKTTRFDGYTLSFSIGSSDAAAIGFADIMAAETGREGEYRKAVFELKDGKFVFTTDYRSGEAATAAGTNCYVRLGDCIESTNYEIDNTANNNNLQVGKRKITVVVNGATGNPGHVYGNQETPIGGNRYATAVYNGQSQNGRLTELLSGSAFNSFFSVNDTDWNGDTGRQLNNIGLSLSMNNPIDCGIYDLIPGAKYNGNFDITFHGIADDGTTSSDYLAKFIITKAPITVSVAYKNSDNSKSEIEFGDGIVYEYHFFDGNTNIDGSVGYNNNANTNTSNQVGYLGNVKIKNGASAAFGNDEYIAWSTGAGTYYLGYNLDSLWFRNYSVTCPGASLTVKPRLINPTVVGEYTYNYGEVIHDGKYSTPITPTLDFGTVESYDTSNYSVCLNAIELSYRTAASGTYTTVTPSDAGTYYVRLTLKGANGGNYRFDNSGANTTTVSGFEIKKLKVDIAWNGGGYLNVAEGADYTECFISGYDATFIDFVSFVHPVIGTNGQTTNENIAQGAEKGQYQIVNDGSARKFSFTPQATGDYMLTVHLKSTNYILNDEESTSADIILTLRVTNDNGVIAVTIKNNAWEYNQNSDGIAGNVSATFNGQAFGLDSFADMYAKVDTSYGGVNSILEELAGKGYVFNEYENADYYLSGLGVAGRFRSHALEFGGNVGTYVMRLQYNGHFGYCVFTVTPKEISLPVFGTWSNPKYTGDWHSQEINLGDVKDSVSITADCAFTTTANGYMLTARDKGDYTVTFAPISDNYVFAAGTEITRIWSIALGENKVTFVNSSETFVYSGMNTYVINVSADFGGNISYSYRADGTTEWVNGKPVNAGTYTLRATSAARDGYYSASDAEITLVIQKAELHAVPSGTVVYGNAFDAKGNYGFTVSGFVGGQTSTGVSATVNNVTYILCYANGSVVTGAGLPVVGTAYKLRLETFTDSVYGEIIKGLEYSNYVVKLTDNGTFTVTPRPVTVTVPSRSSVYGDAIDLSWTGATVKDAQGNTGFGTLNYADVLGYITLRISNDNGDFFISGNTPNADRYAYSAICKSGSEADFANFDVSFAYSQYVVTKRLISIGGITVTSGNVDTALPTVVTALTGVAGKDSETLIIGSLIFTYSGANVSGGSTTNFNDVKTVGSYTVTVSLATVYAENYELTGITAYSFTVAKRSLISDDIVIESRVYTGEALIPTVTYKGYDETRFNELFDVTYGNDWKNVGTYTVLVTIKSQYADDYQWTKVSGATQSAEFEITPAKNIVTSLTVKGWTYGETANEPEIATTFDPDGSKDKYTFTYRSIDGKIVNGTPTQAGQYMVFVYITPTTNNYVYDGNDPQNIGFATFAISKATVGVPTLTIVSDGDGKNDVYTGGVLSADVNGFDSTYMDVVYSGISNLSGGKLYVQAVNAGSYTVTLILKDSANYEWGSADRLDGDGNVSLSWTVAKQKVARPFDSGRKMIVNGKILEYIPSGFDSSVMTITDNLTGYGGKFTAKVDLIDTDNYEWEDGSTETVEIVWEVIGSNTVFGIVAGTVSGAAVVLGSVAAVMYIKLRKKRRLEAEVRNNE